MDSCTPVCALYRRVGGKPGQRHVQRRAGGGGDEIGVARHYRRATYKIHIPCAKSVSFRATRWLHFYISRRAQRYRATRRDDCSSTHAMPSDAARYLVMSVAGRAASSSEIFTTSI